MAAPTRYVGPVKPTPPATADLYDEHAAIIRVVAVQWLRIGQRGAFCGPAVTVKTHEDNSQVREAFNSVGDGRVLVVDGGGSMRRALVGDRLAARAIDNGWAGAVVWGCVRDRAIIDTMDFGIWCLGTTPAKTIKRGQGQLDIEIEIGGAQISPGDWIYADADGVVVAPRKLHADA